MANITGASLAPIYQRLNDAPSYHPLEADTFADWSLEAGDIVTITRDGKEYQSPVHTSSVSWRKKQMISLSSKGNESREAISKISQRKYGKGSSSLRNSEYQHIYVEDSYQQMKAGLELTTSTAVLYVDNKYTQMSAGLALTSSSAALYVDNKYNQMRAGLALTSSSAALYVDNKYNQMKAGLDITSSSAALYARSAENAAEIAARINESTGESEIRLNAQKVYIGNQRSTTVINGKLEASEFDAQHIAALLTNTSVLSTAYMFSTSMEIGTGTFTMDDFDCYIPDAFHALQIVQDGNTYKLQGKHFYSLDWADIGSFSRAVNSASWGWVSGYPKVTLSPQGQSFNGSGLTLDGITYSNKTWTQDKKKFSARFYVYDVSGNEPYGDELLIDTEDSWNAGWDGYYDSGYWASPLDNSGTCLRPKKDRTGSETWFTLDVNIPSNQIYTTDNNPRGTKLTTLRDRFIQAQQDSEYVCFRIDCGGVQKWYYMEP